MKKILFPLLFILFSLNVNAQYYKVVLHRINNAQLAQSNPSIIYKDYFFANGNFSNGYKRTDSKEFLSQIFDYGISSGYQYFKGGYEVALNQDINIFCITNFKPSYLTCTPSYFWYLKEDEMVNFHFFQFRHNNILYYGDIDVYLEKFKLTGSDQSIESKKYDYIVPNLSIILSRNFCLPVSSKLYVKLKEPGEDKYVDNNEYEVAEIPQFTIQSSLRTEVSYSSLKSAMIKAGRDKDYFCLKNLEFYIKYTIDDTEYVTNSILTVPYIYSVEVPQVTLEYDQNGSPVLNFGGDSSSCTSPESGSTGGTQNNSLKYVFIDKATGQAYTSLDDIPEGAVCEIQFSLDNTISTVVTKKIVKPTVQYNYINNSLENEFWYNDEYRNAINLCFDYTESFPDDIVFTFLDENKEEIKSNLPTTEFFDDTLGEVTEFKDGGMSNENETIKKIRRIYKISCQKNVRHIQINFNDDNYINTCVPINELKSYQNISHGELQIPEIKCYFNDAIFNLGSDNIVSGGLNNKYKYILSDNNNHTLEYSDLPIKFTKEDFGLTDKENDLNLTLNIYDAEHHSDDTGYEFRHNTIENISFSFPKVPEIQEYNYEDLNCHNDFSGNIIIKKCNNLTDESYTFLISKNNGNNEYTTISENNIANNLSIGTYKLNVFDKNHCVSKDIIFNITQPDTISIIKNSVVAISPKCYGYSDGSISYEVEGGVSPYTFLWNTNATSKNINDIKTGNYEVTITDAHGCKIQENFYISEPEKLKNLETNDNFTICKDGQLQFYSKKFDQYSWTLDGKVVYEKDNYVVSQPGHYVLTATDIDGCFVKDSFDVKISDFSFDKCLLVASEAYVGDTLVLVNNYKKNEELFEFTFDLPDIFDVLGVSNDYFYKVIVAEGTMPAAYQITMNIHGPDCISNDKRLITILNGIRPENYEQSIIENTDNFVDIKMGPNPSDGNFNLDIVLSEDADLEMRLYSISNPKLLKTEKYHGDNKYYISCNDGLNPGQYLLMLKSKGQTKVMKFMVTK